VRYAPGSMSLRLDLRLPSLPAEPRRRLESALSRLPIPADEVWVVSVLESGATAEGEWLILVTGGVERPEAADWAFVAVEDVGEGERVCTYARRLPLSAQSPEAVARSVEELLGASAAHPKRAKLA
jgi:hypothetical protein